METNENNANRQDMNEARKPKRTLEQALKEGNCVTFKEFEKEMWRQFDLIYKNKK